MQFYDNSKIRPAKSGEYYAITEGGSHIILGYSSVHHAWNVRDDKDLYDPETEIKVACWAFKPKTDQALLNMVPKEV